MATYRSVVYEKFTAFKKDFDDTDLTLNQVIYATTLAVNTVMMQHLTRTGHINSYLEIFDVAVTKHEDKGWYEFELPAGIFDLFRDYGIKFITYDKKEDGQWLCTPFQWIDYDEYWRVKHSPYECPSPKNPYFTRVKNKVHLLGIEKLVVRTVTCGLYVTVPVGATIDLDEEIPLDEGHLVFATQLIDNLLRFALVITPDKQNDGSDLSERFNNLPALFKQNEQAQQQEQQSGERQMQYDNRQ